MKREIIFIYSPVQLKAPVAEQDGATGAVVEFYGYVRATENGGTISGLTYEAYEGMARKEFHRILDELEARHPCQEIHVTHSLGFVAVGEASLHVRVRSKHRAEAFALAQGLIDRMKQDVPIWKRAN